MKIKMFKNGAYTTIEKINGWYLVQLRDTSGELQDKVRCDTYKSACEYLRCFNGIAKNYA